jgi:hypothetical protein
MSWAAMTLVISLGTTGASSATAQAGASRVWVASAIHAEVVVIDVATGAVEATLTPEAGTLCDAGSAGFVDLAAGPHGVWVADSDGRVCLMDPEALRAEGSFRPAGEVRNAYNLAAGSSGLWVVGDPFFWHLSGGVLTLGHAVPVEYQEDTALDVTVAGGRVWGLRRTWPWALYHVPEGGGASTPDSTLVEGAYPETLGSGFGSLWAYGSADPSGMTLLRLDPERGHSLARISIPNGADWHEAPTLAVGENHVWLGMGELGVVGRVDPRSDAYTGEVEVGGFVWSLAAGAGSVWAGIEDDEGEHTLVRIDPVTLEVTGRIALGDVPPKAVAVR